MVWIDGKLETDSSQVNENPPYRGHDWTYNPDGRRYAVGVKRSIAMIEPGSANILVSLWPSSPTDSTAYLDASVAIQGQPSPFVLPTVPANIISAPVILRTLFNCSTADVDQDGFDLAAAGLNAITLQLFNSPGDNPAWDTLKKTQDAWDVLVRPGLNWAKARGLKVLGNGDAAFRTVQQRDFTHNGQFSQEYYRGVAATLRDEYPGLVMAVDMVDEAEPPENYLPEEFIGWWRAENGPPLAWPQVAGSPYPRAYEVPVYSDYASRYEQWWQWKSWRADRHSQWEVQDSTSHQVASIPGGWSFITSVGTTGPYYQKKVPGGDYQTGDDLLAPGSNGANISTEIFLRLGCGSSGFRCYAYDFKLWRDQRLNAVPGVVLPDGLQTGSRPGDERWGKMREAFLWIAAHEAELIAGTIYVPTISGPWVFCRRGEIVLGINTTDRALPSPLPGGIVVGQISESSTVPAGAAIVWNHA